jgi:hypothetical protein
VLLENKYTAGKNVLFIFRYTISVLTVVSKDGQYTVLLDMYFVFRESIPRNFVKFRFAKSYEISRNFFHEIKFLAGRYLILNFLTFLYHQKENFLVFQVQIRGSGSVPKFPGSETLIKIEQ